VRIHKSSSNCGGFRPPKGHMDSQMFPECEGTPADRDIVKKTRERRNRNKKRKNVHAQVLETPQECYCSKCGVCMGNMTQVDWLSKDESCDACSGRLIKTPVPPKTVMPLAATTNIEKSLFKMAQGDVWNLESEDNGLLLSEEEFASDMLWMVVDKALEGDEKKQRFLIDLWDGENWDSIKSKVLAEGRTWYVWWMDGVRKFNSQLDTTNVEASSNSLTIEAKKKKKKKKKWNPNPWAVCHTTVDKDKNPSKYERCVKKVKKNQAFNLSKFKKIANNAIFLMQNIQSKWNNFQIAQAIKALGEESISGFSNVTPEDVPEILAMSQEYVLGEIKEWLSSRFASNMVHKTVVADGGFSGNEAGSFAVDDVTEEIPCQFCNKSTINTGTKLCNTCWMIKEYLEYPLAGGDKEYIYRMTLQSNPELVAKIKQSLENVKSL